MTRNEFEIMLNKKKKLNKRQIAAIEELTGHKHQSIDLMIRSVDVFIKENKLWNEKCWLWIGVGCIVWERIQKDAYGNDITQNKGIPYEWLLPLGKILEGDE